MRRMSSQCWMLALIIAVQNINHVASSNSFIELEQYYRMPKLHAYDDYDECLDAYDTQEPVYCVARSIIKPENQSELWRFIKDFSSDTYRHFRHDHLDRGLCVEGCRRLVSQLDNETANQLYVEKFDIDFPYIISAETFENVHQDQVHYGRLINICENYILRKVYNLTAYTEIEYCTRPVQQLNVDLLDMSFVGISMLLVFLVIASSLLDYKLKSKDAKNDHYKNNIASDRTMLLTSFSLKRNWYRLTSRSKDQLNEDLRFFQTFRFFTFCLVVVGHCSDMFSVTPISNTFDREKEYYSAEGLAVINGSQIVQTFFEMSGFLLSIHFFTTRSRMKKIEWTAVLAVLVYRYIRLTPAYAYVMLLHSTWLPKFQDGPLWNRGAQTEKYFCRQNWWTNLLYVNNYVNSDKPCLQQAWYLACDFQLFALGMIAVVAVAKYPKLRNALYSTIMALAYIIPALIIYFGGFDGAFINRLQDERFIYWYDRMYHMVYIPFHTNMGCYFGGIILGTIYYKQRKNYHKGNRSWFLQLLWYCTVPVGFLCLMSNMIFYQYNFEKPSIWMAIFYPVMKNMWIFLGTITLYGVIYQYNKVINGFLNFSIFVPLGRLTYCAYVCHVFMLKNVFFGTREIGYFSKMSLLSKAIPVVVFSYILALILALLLEFPATAVQKHLFAKKIEEVTIDPKATYTENNNVIKEKETSRV
ncbi:nose resistant to fluoxetine protein 6-like [Toxorhynchites rutilus septentrionalis]|uniref:nose resistant to fluoxetine protein 6-like n=1 Tax=Toxorhynchites rutilus septentrionalis TaxID=329112 RepID=UPI002478E7AB|nr:nose resistant to fluoxetine protein 6-like [Toxorhynchites rutilus septentrionalis]